ncbi:MAG TPA: hypothetical protein VFH40_10365 [Gemmatimonadales bacterium]|nr:hypothetical protein [Gemmatimonadales bacterium]
MSKLPPREHESNPTGYSDSLSDRVVERVLNARLILEKTAGAGPRGAGANSGPVAGVVDAETAGELRELQSLKRVFRDLGHTYRRHRKETGGPVNPDLREAAYQFRANPSLPALIAVAAYLDRMDLLS